MKHQLPIEYGKYYHIYSRGKSNENLFLTPENYYHFLSLYDKYISLVAETYALSLTPNHFHLLIRVKEEASIGLLKPKRGQKTPPKKANPEKQLGHLFNAYTLDFNAQNNRKGGLFEHPFKRAEVTSHAFRKLMVYYIHSNPVMHGVAESMIDWPWSSYRSITSTDPSKLSRVAVLDWFDGKANYIAFHNKQQDLDLIKPLLLEG